MIFLPKLLLKIPRPYDHIFVARNLANLPHLSMLNCDDNKLLQEIEILKSELRILSVSPSSMEGDLLKMQGRMNQLEEV